MAECWEVRSAIANNARKDLLLVLVSLLLHEIPVCILQTIFQCSFMKLNIFLNLHIYFIVSSNSLSR